VRSSPVPIKSMLSPMAKRLRSPTRRPQSRPTKVRAPKRPQLLADPLVAERTETVLQLLQEGGEKDVYARAKVGGILREVRDHLPYGNWLRWIVEQLPFTGRTARRAITLHAYQQKDHALFDKVAPLGVAKAYLLMTLHKTTTQQILKTKHTIPSTGARKAVRQMSFPELLEIVSKVSALPASDPAAALVGSYRRQVRRLIHTLDALVDNRAHIREDEVEELHDTLLTATEQFARAFELDED
jgi:hypothetical protein